MFDLDKNFRSLSIASNIGYSDTLSTSQTYIIVGHSLTVTKSPKRTVWERMKEALKDARLPSNQTYAAKLVGITQPSISEWNTPGGYPTLKSAEIIARKTNTCVEWLLTERGPKHPGPPEDYAAEQLWSLWAHLPDLVRGELLGMARASVARALEDSTADMLQAEVPAIRPHELQRR